MADTKISAFPNASALGGTEQLAGVQSTNDVNVTPNQIKTFTSASPTLVSPTMTGAALGTPNSGTLTNCTGLPTAGVVGTAAILGANTFTALQTITQASANAGVIASTGYSLTGANAQSLMDLAGTLNTSGAPDVLRLSVTNSGSSGSTNLLNLKVGGSSVFKVQIDGALQTAKDAYLGPNLEAFIGAGGGAGSGFNTISTGFFGWISSTTNAYNTPDTLLTRKGAANPQFGAADAASPVAQALSVQSVVAGNANVAGVNTTLKLSSLSNGSGLSGDTIFQTGDTGAASGSQNALVTALTLKGGTAQGKSGSVVIGSAALATNASDGFLYIPSCAGTPNGTPTAFTGRTPIVFDTNANILWAYDAGWLQPKTAGTFIVVSWQ